MPQGGRGKGAAALAAALFLTAPGLARKGRAQEVEVYSEFRRPGPDGVIVLQDRAGSPREILSPAAARNAFLSFHVVVHGPPGKRVTMYLGSNPERLIQPTLYREHFDANGIPDRLERIDKQPFYEVLPEGVAVFWVDVFVPRSTPNRRVRFEIQVNADDRWIVYPMEIRVQPVLIPQLVLTSGALAPASAPSAATSFNTIEPYLCGKTSPRVTLADASVRAFLRRNASQDLALARVVEERKGREAVRSALLRAAGIDAGAGCQIPGVTDPEVYLRVRDALMRMAAD